MSNRPQSDISGVECIPPALEPMPARIPAPAAAPTRKRNHRPARRLQNRSRRLLPRRCRPAPGQAARSAEPVRRRRAPGHSGVAAPGNAFLGPLANARPQPGSRNASTVRRTSRGESHYGAASRSAACIALDHCLHRGSRHGYRFGARGCRMRGSRRCGSAPNASAIAPGHFNPGPRPGRLWSRECIKAGQNAKDRCEKERTARRPQLKKADPDQMDETYCYLVGISSGDESACGRMAKRDIKGPDGKWSNIRDAELSKYGGCPKPVQDDHLNQKEGPQPPFRSAPPAASAMSDVVAAPASSTPRSEMEQILAPFSGDLGPPRGSTPPPPKRGVTVGDSTRQRIRWRGQPAGPTRRVRPYGKRHQRHRMHRCLYRSQRQPGSPAPAAAPTRKKIIIQHEDRGTEPAACSAQMPACARASGTVCEPVRRRKAPRHSGVAAPGSAFLELWARNPPAGSRNTP